MQGGNGSKTGEGVMTEEPAALRADRQGSVPRQRRALIVKFGSIGDVIMAIPGAGALHASGYAVDWVASEAIAPLLRLYPWIHVIAVDEPSLLRGPLAERVRVWARLRQNLHARARHFGAYDLLATLYYDKRYSWLTALIPAKRKLRLSQTDRRFALLPGRHHTDEYARILCRRADGETPRQLAPVRLKGLPAPHLARKEARPRIVLVPAGARNVLRDDSLRRWPVEQYVTLAGALLEQGCEVLLIGGPDDHWAKPYFEQFTAKGAPSAVVDLIGSLSLVDTLALLDSATVTVTHDTGPLHMAGITATAIVALFGPTDPHGRLPRRNDAVAIWGGEGFACRPCYDGREYAPCSHNGCLSGVTPAHVLREVMALVQDRAARRERPPRVILPRATPEVRLEEHLDGT